MTHNGRIKYVCTDGEIVGVDGMYKLGDITPLGKVISIEIACTKCDTFGCNCDLDELFRKE